MEINRDKTKKKKINEKRLRRKLNVEFKRKQIIKNYYTEELKLCEHNWKKCEEKWDPILRQIKLEDIKKDIVALKDIFHVYMEGKSEQVAIIMDTFENLYGNSRILSTGHMNGLHRLEEIYESRMRHWSENYRNTEMEMRTELKKEELAAEVKEVKNQEILKTLLSFEAERGEFKDDEMQSLMDDVMLDIASEHWNDMEKLEYEHEESMEWLLLKMQTNLKTLFYFSREKVADYEQLKSKDEWYFDIILEDRFKIKKLRRQIRNMRAELNDNFIEEMPDVKLLKQNYLDKNAALALNLEDDKMRLKNLSVSANQTTEFLHCLWKKLERILELKRLCGQLERDNERKTQLLTELRPLQSMAGIRKLEPFWEHYGKVELTLNALKEEIRILENERNTRKLALRHIFERYC